MLIGCHVSVAGGLHLAFTRAQALGCETAQIFTQNQRQWRATRFSAEQIELFRDERQAARYGGSPLVSHASYLINLCAQEDEKLHRSRQALKEELQRCDALGIEYLVVHPGSHGGKGNAWGIDRIARSIQSVFNEYQPKVCLLLETIAGQGTGVGYRFEELAAILDAVDRPEGTGVCVDTCHIFAAGYDIRQGWDPVLKEMVSTFGLEAIKVFHLNDSMKPFASRKDRHAPIGQGMIGGKSFEILMQDTFFKKIPGILEVPGGDDVVAENIKWLQSKREMAYRL